MNKLAFVFPGQGAQAVGMGKDLFEQYDVAKRLFAEADEALGYSIKDMCFEGPADDLKLTANTQPAILTVSVIVNEILKEHGVQPDVAGGHSLGEYSALVAAGVLSFKDAVALVHKRGQYMQEAVPARFPVPAQYAHPIVLTRMIRVLREGRAQTAKEALEVLKSDLRALNSSVQVTQEEYDEVVVIKPLFLVCDYQ